MTSAVAPVAEPRPPRTGTLATASLALASAASLAGLVAPRIYRDEPIIRDAWIVNDALTLLVAVPVLALANRFAARGSTAASLVRLGALHYVLYNYAFYLFGAKLNELTLGYAFVVAVTGWALVAAARAIDPPSMTAAVARAPARRVAAWMAFVAAGLSITWIAQWLVALTRTTAPGRFDLTPDFIRTVAGIDMTLMVGVLVPGAVLLWRRRPWGFVLGAAINTSGALYNLVLAGGTVVQIRAGMAGAAPLLALWTGLLLGCAASAASLVRRAGERP